MSPYYGYAPRKLATSGGAMVIKNSLYADPLVPCYELIERQKLHICLSVGDQAMSFMRRLIAQRRCVLSD